MKTPFKTILLIALLFPAFASAQDPFDAYVQTMIEQAQEAAAEGNGTVIIENHSSVSTGGQTAAAGQSVTDGDVSASSHVETYISTNDDGGTVQIKVETSENGETETHEYTEDIEPGEPVNVNVSAHADPDGADVQMSMGGESVDMEDIDTEDAEDPNGVRITVAATVEHALDSIPEFFKKVFSFFWSW